MSFIVLFVSQRTGYAEYQNHRQALLTKAQIKKFEKDVSLGKAVDISKYLKTNNHNYQNRISKAGLKVSKSLQFTVKSVVVKGFKVLSKIAEEG